MLRQKRIPVPRPRPTDDACATAPATPLSAMPLTDALAIASMNAMSADLPAVKQAIGPSLPRSRSALRAIHESRKSMRPWMPPFGAPCSTLSSATRAYASAAQPAGMITGPNAWA